MSNFLVTLFLHLLLKLLAEIVLRKSFQLCARSTCSRHARLRTPNDFLMKVKRAQLTGNENAA